MTKEEADFFRLFGSIFAGVGSIFLIAGIIIGVNTYSYLSKSIITQGTVIDLEKRISKDSDGYSYALYYPIIKFTANSGKVTQFEANSGSYPPAYTKGKKVEIIYNPQEPESAMINSGFDSWFLPIMCTGMGSLFVIIGGIPLVKSFLPRE